MRFGYGLVSCERHPDDPRPAGELYREAVDLARHAEELGLDSIWTTEHHFVDSEYLPSPLTLCAAMAAVTARLTVGTAVALAPLYQPVRLAEDAAVVDLIAGGRFVLGLGLGWSNVEFAALGPERAQRGRALDEILDVLAQAGEDRVVVHHGKLYDVPEVSIRPKPSNGGLRVWIGGSADPALRRAARLAGGVILHNAPPDVFRAQLAIVRDELERAGRDPSAFEIAVYMTIVPDRGGHGWERYRELALHAQWKYTDMGRSARRVGQPLPHRGDDEADREALVRSTTLTGSAESIAEQLAAYREAAGPDLHVIARNYLPGAGAEGQRELMERFAQDVVPLLR